MYSTRKKELYAGTVALMFLFLVIYTTSANATLSELGKNASNTGETILNQTGEVAKKIVGGVANVLSNISGEIKEGVGDK